MGMQTANPTSREAIHPVHFLTTLGALLDGSSDIGLAPGALSKRVPQD